MDSFVFLSFHAYRRREDRIYTCFEILPSTKNFQWLPRPRTVGNLRHYKPQNTQLHVARATQPLKPTDHCVFSLASAGIWLHCSPWCLPRCCYNQHFPCISYGVSSVKNLFLRRLLPNFCQLAELDLAFYSVKTLSDTPRSKLSTHSQICWPRQTAELIQYMHRAIIPA